MDIGLDRLIAMFEERFGRRASTILLFLIAFAAGAWALHAIYVYVLLPGYHASIAVAGYFGGTHLKIGPENLLTGLTSLFFGSVGVIVFMTIGHFWERYIRRRATQVLADTQKIIERCQDFTERNHAKLEAEMLKAEEMMAEAQRLIAQARAEPGHEKGQ